MGVGTESVSVTEKALSMSDSIYLVLLIAVGVGFWRLIVWILKYQREREKELMEQNEAREKRYIGIMEEQAVALQEFRIVREDVKDIKQYLYNKGGMDNAKRD